MRKILLFSFLSLSVQLAFGQRPVKALHSTEGSNVKAIRAAVDRENRVKNMNCIDTVRYPLLKEQLLTDSTSGQYYTFSIWNADTEAFSQKFTYSGTGLSITGVEFFGANFIDAVNALGTASITVRARIMSVNASNNPTGGALATGTTTVTSTTPGFYYVNFGTPYSPTGNYAVVIDVTSADGILDMWTNDAFSGQVQDENLSRFKSGYYPNSLGAWVSIPTLTTGDAANFPSNGIAPDPAYDFEPFVAPIVSYAITSTATVAADPVCLGTAQTFTGTAGPTNILSDRMYNYNAFAQYFLGAASDSTYVWDTGDPSPYIWSTNASYTYPASGAYTPAFIVLGGFWNSCLDFATDAIVVNEPSTAPTSITGTTSICSGGTTVLTATGGTAGTGSSYEWGTGSVVGSNVIAGETTSTYTTPALSTTTTYWVRRKDTAPCNTTTGGATVTVTVATPSTAPTVIGGTTTVCSGATASLTATGGLPGTNCTYEWGTGAVGTNVIAGATTQTLTTSALTSTTTFWARRIDGAPCSNVTAEATVTVTVNALPTVSASTTNAAICGLTSTTLNASGATNYTWDNSAGTGASVSVSPASNTTYTVTGTDNNGCTNTSSVAITVTPAQDATFSYGTSTVCATGSNVTPTVTTPGGTFATTGALSFVSTSTGEINVSATPAGSYTITYTTAGTCPGTASATMNITTSAISGFSYSPNSVCAGNTSTIDPTFVTGGTPGTFTVSSPNLVVSGSGTVLPSLSQPGTYTVTNSIAASGSCPGSVSTTTFTITSGPAPSITSVAALCSTDNAVTLSATPVGGTFSGTGVSGTTFSPTAGSSVVTYTVTDGSGCTGSNTISITVTTTPAPQFGSVPSPLCSSAGSVTLNATPIGGTYSGTGVSGNTFNPSQANVGSNNISYTLTTNGCTGGTITAIVVNAPPTPSISPVGSVCNNAGNVTLVATPAGGTFAGTGVTGNVFNVSQAPGPYNVYYTYTDGNGCTGNAGTSITILAAPTASFAALNPICLQDGSINLAGGAPSGGTYSGTGVSGGMFDPAVSGAGTFTIDYIYTAANGCSDNASNTITVNDCAGIEELEAIAVTVAPNPASSEFKIIGTSDMINIISFVIMSEDGKLVKGAQTISANETVVNTEAFANGVYFIQFFSTEGVTVKKLIVRK